MTTIYRLDPVMAPMSFEFWESYEKMRKEFSNGEYVRFLDGKFLDKSTEPYPMTFTGKWSCGHEYVHKVYEGDAEHHKRLTNYERKQSLSDQDTASFLELLKTIEKKTGKFYEITIRQGNGEQTTLGDLNKRNSYTLYDMVPKYKYLEGIYSSIQEMNQKKTLHKYEPYAEDHIFETNNDYDEHYWKCGKCHSWGTEIQRNSGSTCLSCGFSIPDYHLGNPTFSPSSGSVYLSSGGSLGVCTPVGFIKINN